MGQGSAVNTHSECRMLPTSPALSLFDEDDTPRYVYRMASGNVFCFDARNRMIRHLCGPWERLESLIRLRADARTEWM